MGVVHEQVVPGPWAACLAGRPRGVAVDVAVHLGPRVDHAGTAGQQLVPLLPVVV